MTKLNKLSLALAAAAGMVFAGSASAFTITAGDYKMTVDAFINGTIYGAGCGSENNAAGDILACDGAAAIPSVGSTGSEDSWGILSIASITNTTTNTQMFTRVTDGYLIGDITGITDFYSIALGGGIQKDYAVGGTINLYTSATNFDPTVPSANQAAVINSVTNLPLYLSLDFTLGAALGTAGNNSTYTSTFDTTSGQGAGSGYLNVTGGSAAVLFDTNSLTTAINTKADAKLSVTLFSLTPADSACGISPTGVPVSGDPLALPQECNWLSGPTVDVRGHTIPEPTTLALLGMGLVGLAGLRRRSA